MADVSAGTFATRPTRWRIITGVLLAVVAAVAFGIWRGDSRPIPLTITIDRSVLDQEGTPVCRMFDSASGVRSVGVFDGRFINSADHDMAWLTIFEVTTPEGTVRSIEESASSPGTPTGHIRLYVQGGYPRFQHVAGRPTTCSLTIRPATPEDIAGLKRLNA